MRTSTDPGVCRAGFLRLLSALLITGVVATSAAAHGPGHKPSTAAASADGASHFEIAFLKNMIDHHAMAIHMARVCSTKAEHSELRQLCEQIMTAQEGEITTMQSWLQSWYGLAHHAHMKPGEMRQMERLEALSGSAFEIEFLEMMIQHHRKAVRMADQCLRRATHTDLRQLCQSVHTTQQAEITQMKGWLCQWYTKCR